jgi:hypothetical protein
VWPADKHITLEEAFHFAACAKRIGKVASLEKRKFTSSIGSGDLEGGANSDAEIGCQAPIFLVWKDLGCCDGLCGSALGMAVRGGFDVTVAWLCSTLTFGGQTLVEAMDHRLMPDGASQSASPTGKVSPADFDCRPPGFEKHETESVVHPKPIPEVLDSMKKVLEQSPNDEVLKTGKCLC